MDENPEIDGKMTPRELHSKECHGGINQKISCFDGKRKKRILKKKNTEQEKEIPRQQNDSKREAQDTKIGTGRKNLHAGFLDQWQEALAKVTEQSEL